MRADAVNSHGYPVRTEMTAPSSHVCSTDEDESEGIIVHETLSQSCSKERGLIKRNYRQRNFIGDLFHGRGKFMF